MEKNKPIRFQLRQITTEQFAVIGEPPTEETINVSTRSNFRYSDDKPALGVFVELRFNEKDTPFLLIEAGCHFEIEESDWESLKDRENNTIRLPKDFAVHLLMLTIGTIRGILHAKTENTPLNKFFVPLLNVLQMVNSDIILDNTSIPDDK
ncbi:MAG: hypothetical protein HF312_19380 [Ignavibacteria bacterium]|jgi:hypothetical protein|nr:hypothetical protein [Ignavibacteria bacterium]